MKDMHLRFSNWPANAHHARSHVLPQIPECLENKPSRTSRTGSRLCPCPSFLGMNLEKVDAERSAELNLPMGSILLNQMEYIIEVLMIGDKFGESPRASQATPSFWKVPGLPRKFPKLPRKFFGDFPGSSLTVELNSNPGVPRKFPRLPRKFPGLPRKFPGLPRRSALSLGSLTPSPDSQKLSLR